jgi:purine-binding chemotaxis protein CheW
MKTTIGQVVSIQLVVFRLDTFQYGLRLSSVIRVLRAVEVTPLPKAPRIVIGVINLAGRIIPVVNLRRRFGLPERDLQLTDQLIIATTSGGATTDGGRILALVVDDVEGVLDCAAGETLADAIVPGLEHLHGVARSEEGLILIHDLDTFLSLEEDKALSRALTAGTK